MVADTLRDLLARSGVLAHAVLPPEPDAVLAALEVSSAPQDLGGGISTGGVVLVHELSKSPIPGFDFGLAIPEPGITIPFKLKLEPPDAASPRPCTAVILDGSRPVRRPSGSIGASPEAAPRAASDSCRVRTSGIVPRRSRETVVRLIQG